MNCVVREMAETDWESVCSIYSQALADGGSTFQTECPSYHEWDKAHKQDCRMVAVVEGRVAGWCALSPTSARAVYQGVVEVSIYVDKQFRNLGLGTTLLKKLCQVSEEHGYWSLYAAIFSVNTASIRLHKKCGFREIGYREKIAKDRFGIWQDTTLLELRNAIR